jgi:hypothetical protein
MADEIKRSDQVAMLKAYRDFTDTGTFKGIFAYPNCGNDLYRMGLLTDDGKVTDAARAALWLLGEGDDPLPDTASSFSFTLPSRKEGNA